MTPPGSGCSIIFGKNVTAAAPGSASGLHLIVSDIQAARDELLRRGIKISEPFHDAGGPRMVRRLNIDGDGQGDLADHGGEHRAVLVYQHDSYRYWQN